MPRKKITNTNTSSFYHEPAVWMVGLAYLAGMLMILLVGVMVNPTKPSGLNSLAASASLDSTTGKLSSSPVSNIAVLDENNLVRNGSFEMPITRTLSSVVVGNNPQLGWNVEWTTRGGRTGSANRLAGVEILSGYKDWQANDGAQFARLDVADIKAREQKANSLVTLSQEIKTQAKDYHLVFWYAPQPGTDVEDNKLTVRWNGVVLDEVEVSGTKVTDPVWKEYAFDIKGTGSIGKLEFIGEGLENGQGNLLDNVSLVEKK